MEEKLTVNFKEPNESKVVHECAKKWPTLNGTSCHTFQFPGHFSYLGEKLRSCEVCYRISLWKMFSQRSNRLLEN